MTRETKIGLLTGLGVIVLIGVLLSEYLGGAPRQMMEQPAAMTDKGADYRAAAVAPVGVPVVDGRSIGAPGMDGAGQTNYTVMAAPDRGVAPATDGGSGPVVGQPVVPQPMGRMPDAAAGGRGAAGGPPMDLTDPVTGRPLESAVYVSVAPGGAGPTTLRTAAGLPSGEMYGIVAGDNLTKIARKFYKSAGKADIQRIVAANPSLLKDAGTPLIVGKKLLIPGAPAAPAVAAPGVGARGAVPGAAVVPAGRARDVVIGIPGSAGRVAPDAGVTARVPAPRAEEARPAAVTTYKVAAGDSLGKIARKFYGTASKEAVKRIMAANKIATPEELKAGAVLTIPAAGASAGGAGGGGHGGSAVPTPR